MTRVVIADDHPFLRTGVEAVLSSAGIEIAGSAGDGNEALQVIARCDPDVAIIDVQMPDRDGIGVLEAMRTDGDQRPVILLTAHIDDDRLIAALRANVNAIVFKQGAEQSLVETIERVERGEKVIDPALTSRALDLTLTGVGTLDRLAPRERQIADAVAKGLRNREIGAQLGMTEGSIKVYLNRIFDKVGVENRTELAILVHGKGRS